MQSIGQLIQKNSQNITSLMQEFFCSSFCAQVSLKKLFRSGPLCVHHEGNSAWIKCTFRR